MGELTAVLDVEDLALRIRTWDNQAVTDFSKHFGPRLRNYFIWRGLCDWEAEDLSVTCISNIVTKIDLYQPQKRGGFEAWVLRIARNTLYDQWRKRRREEPLPDDYDAAAENVEPDLDTKLAFEAALSQLSENDQQVINLRFFKGRPFEEVGAALGVKVGAARTRYCRAMQRLEAILEKDPRVDMKALRGLS